MVIEDLRKSWITMFEHIDDIVEKIVKEYPEFEKNLNRTLIHNAVKDTMKLERLLTEAEKRSEKAQRNFFNDNN